MLPLLPVDPTPSRVRTQAREKVAKEEGTAPFCLAIATEAAPSPAAPPSLRCRRADLRRGIGPRWGKESRHPVAGVVARKRGRARRRRTVAELSLPLHPTAVGSLVAAHGGAPVNLCRRKRRCRRRKALSVRILSWFSFSVEFLGTSLSLHVVQVTAAA